MYTVTVNIVEPTMYNEHSYINTVHGDKLWFKLIKKIKIVNVHNFYVQKSTSIISKTTNYVSGAKDVQPINVFSYVKLTE